MVKIKVVGLHPWMEDVTGIVKLLHIKDEKIINRLEYDIEEPNIVIATEHIYRSRRLFYQFSQYYKDGKALLVFLGGEAVYPDLNLFDYVIGYSKKLVDNDRISRIPPNLFFENTLDICEFKNGLSYEEAQACFLNRKFCNFLYSNPYAHPMRDKLFYEISKYKQVEAIGKHLNNTGVQSTREEKNWGLLSVGLKSDYRFTIASENAYFEGYTSEKLLSTFMSHSIPIYWGNPDVAEEYNEKAFINCNKYSDFEVIVAKIKELDNNGELWAKMVSEPWQTKSQEEQMKKEIKEYEAFINKVFSYESLRRFRRPLGTFIDLYNKFVFRDF